MKKIGREFVLSAVLPIIVAMICVTGLNGDLTQLEALVPAYLLGLILAFVALGIYVIAVMFRAIRWMAAGVR